MRYLTTGDVASRCQVSVGTVKNWIEAENVDSRPPSDSVPRAT